MSDIKRCLLIVEDEPDLRAILRELIEIHLDCDILEAENGRRALELILDQQKHNRSIDTILSDINMPEMNGLIFLKKLREHGFETPFIVLTAHGEKQSAVTALQLGAFDFVDKPFTASNLIQSINSALELGHSNRSIDDEIDMMILNLKLNPEEAALFRDLKRKLLGARRNNQIA